MIESIGSGDLTTLENELISHSVSKNSLWQILQLRQWGFKILHFKRFLVYINLFDFYKITSIKSKYDSALHMYK